MSTDFPVKLCQSIERMGHQAFLIEKKEGHPRVFSSDGLEPDIYVLLDPSKWPKSFPAVVIETKSRGSRDLTQVITGVRKVIELRWNAPKFKIGLRGDASKVDAPAPGTVLLATPMGVKYGTVCAWEDENRKWSKEAHDAATLTMQRLVWQFGAGLLLKGIWDVNTPPICDVNFL